MAIASSTIVQKLWNYCNILRDDGLSYGDYVEQLTYLLFLKMAHEQTQPPFNKPSIVLEDYNWPSLLELDGDPLEIHYRKTLENLGKQGGMLAPRKAGGLVSGAASKAVGEPPRMLPPEGLRNHRRRGSTAWPGTPSPGPALRGHPLPRKGEG